jgi:hypothetical protein
MEKYKTIIDSDTNPIVFLLTEKQLNHETFLINQLEIIQEEYLYYKG